MLFFDLPVKTKDQRHRYSVFRKELKKNGYIMMQESVYVKLLHNTALTHSETEKIKNYAPEEGSVCILPMSLTLFRGYTAISGNKFDIKLFSDDTIYI